MQHDPNAVGRPELALVLSGGSALGAFQAGAYQALHERALEPDWIAGASAGALNGAVICGNSRDQRMRQLEALWQVTPGGVSASTLHPAADEARRTQAVAATFAAGRQDWFVPRVATAAGWHPFAMAAPASVYDLSPLEGALARLLDFETLNAGTPRLSITAVDVETGADLVFETETHRITPRHLRASASLLPIFQPAEVEGRLVADAGVSANLPLDLVLAAEGARPLLCIAIDLLPLEGGRPRTMGEVLSRTQDLIFASQSRRAIAAWQAVHAERARRGEGRSVMLLHVSYADQEREVSGKAFDFSRPSAQARWEAGHRAMTLALDGLETLPRAAPGLRVHALDRDGRLQPVHHQLAPLPA